MSPQEIGDWGNIYGTLRVNRNLSHVHSGRQSIQISHPTPRAHGADIELAVQDTLVVRYYMDQVSEYGDILLPIGSENSGGVVR